MDQHQHNRKVVKHKGYENLKEKNETKLKQKKESTTDNSISDNPVANCENIMGLKEWINGERQPDSNDAVYLLCQQLVQLIADDDDINARAHRKKFHARMVEDDRIQQKLCKILPKITYYFEDKIDYFRNLDEIFVALNDKIWNYIGMLLYFDTYYISKCSVI